MSISVNLMAAAGNDAALERRLERLTGEEAVGCVPEYRGLAEEIRRSRGFPTALRRAKALADENRLLAVSLLKRHGELCACEIQAAAGLSHATVSHHMSILAEAGIVNSRHDGKWTYYRLRGAPEAGIP